MRRCLVHATRRNMTRCEGESSNAPSRWQRVKRAKRTATLLRERPIFINSHPHIDLFRLQWEALNCRSETRPVNQAPNAPNRTYFPFTALVNNSQYSPSHVRFNLRVKTATITYLSNRIGCDLHSSTTAEDFHRPPSHSAHSSQRGLGMRRSSAS